MYIVLSEYNKMSAFICVLVEHFCLRPGRNLNRTVLLSNPLFLLYGILLIKILYKDFEYIIILNHVIFNKYFPDLKHGTRISG